MTLQLFLVRPPPALVTLVDVRASETEGRIYGLEETTVACEHACEGSTQKGHLTSKKRDNIHSNYFAVQCLVLKNNYNRNFTPTQIAKIYDCHIQRRGNVMRKSLVDVQRPS